MSNLRRYDQPGDHVFIACKTFRNMPILVKNADLLLSAFEYVTGVLDFRIQAWVILPDHFHAMLALGNVRLADAVKRIKEKFARAYRSKQGLRSGRLWQHRYWDHIIRNAADWQHHAQYIHYNPVKHGYASDPLAWTYSSVHQWEKTESPSELHLPKSGRASCGSYGE